MFLAFNKVLVVKMKADESNGQVIHNYLRLMKRDRDLKQSYLVTQLIKDFMFTIDIDVELNNIKNISIEAIEDYKKIILSNSSSGALMTPSN